MGRRGVQRNVEPFFTVAQLNSSAGLHKSVLIGPYTPYIFEIIDSNIILRCLRRSRQHQSFELRCHLFLLSSPPLSSHPWMCGVWPSPEGAFILDQANPRRFQPLSTLDDIDNDALPFAEAGEPGSLKSGDVDENVLPAAITSDKAEALLGVEPFHCPGLLDGHGSRAAWLSLRRCTHVEDLALMIDGAPEIHPLPGDPHHHLV